MTSTTANYFVSIVGEWVKKTTEELQTIFPLFTEKRRSRFTFIVKLYLSKVQVRFSDVQFSHSKNISSVTHEKMVMWEHVNCCWDLGVVTTESSIFTFVLTVKSV